MRIPAAAAAILVALCWPAEGRQARSGAVVREFRQSHVCPSTGLKTGPCPGWEVEHGVSLCQGGPDVPAALKWMAVEQHRAKTRIDVAVCRYLKRAPKSLKP